MKANQNYLTAHVNEPFKVFQFLHQHLNFCEMGNAYPGTGEVAAGNKCGNEYLLVSGASPTKTDQNDFSETIVVNTDDCLKDYHRLRQTGVKVEQAPRYTSKGLEAVFSDIYGNRYVVIEERDYSEL